MEDTSIRLDEQLTWTPEVGENELHRIRYTGDCIATHYPSALQIIQWPEIHEETATETQQFREEDPGLREKSRMKATSASSAHLIHAGFFPCK